MAEVIRPHITYKAFDWLKHWLKPEMSVFEYGSGMSTLWLAKTVRRLVSVENVPHFYREIKHKLSDLGPAHNVEYFLREDAFSFSTLIHEYDESFDLVFVDGKFRKECMEQCFSKARCAIYLDNSNADHYRSAFEVMKRYYGGDIITFYGKIFNPYTGEEQENKSQGSLFVKDGCKWIG